MKRFKSCDPKYRQGWLRRFSQHLVQLKAGERKCLLLAPYHRKNQKKGSRLNLKSNSSPLKKATVPTVILMAASALFTLKPLAPIVLVAKNLLTPTKAIRAGTDRIQLPIPLSIKETKNISTSSKESP